MHNSDTIISHCLCHSIVELLYFNKEKVLVLDREELELKN